MKRNYLLSALVFFAIVLTALPVRSFQNILDYQFKLEDKTIELPKENIEKVRKRINKPTQKSGGQTLSTQMVENLAKEFGLFDKIGSNSHLAFNKDDIAYWSRQKLDEEVLELEFAGRKLVLEAANKQQVVIRNKEMLSEAVRQVIPILKNQKDNQMVNLDDIACEGDTSEQLIEQSWEGLKNKDPLKTMACVGKAIKRWSRQADSQQAKAKSIGCDETPKPTDFKTYVSSFWALSDIATCWFIRGENFYQQGKWAEAREAYKTVVEKYPCAFTWDSRNGWFWRTADAAQEKYEEIRLR
jgi:tetratricopeptide (TPR) repeat protein